MNLLLINDNCDNYILISDLLKNDSVDFANQYNIANQKIMMNSYDLILLDQAFTADIAGDLSESIKVSIKNSKTPFIILLGNVDTLSKANVRKTGAVDFITKPINIFEIQTKLAGHLSNKTNLISNNNSEIHRGAVSMNFVQHEVSCSGVDGDLKYKLTPTEFRLFYFLFERANQLISRTEIFNEIWKKKATDVNQRIVDKHLTALRKKVCQKIFKIEAVHGSGYRMTVVDASCTKLKNTSF